MNSINAAYLETRLSGGSSNADANASLGGSMSSYVARSANVAGVSAVTGVAALDAPGCEVGAGGVLSFVAAQQSLSWRAPGDAVSGDLVVVSEDGRYDLKSGDGTSLYVSVSVSSLPSSDAVDSSVSVAVAVNATWDDVTKEEAWNGVTAHRCFYIYNAHPSESFIETHLYIPQQPVGADSLFVGLDPSGVGGVAPSIGDESALPAGVGFSAPGSLAVGALSVGSLGPGQGAPYWERRVVPQRVTTETPEDDSVVGIYVVY